MVLDLERFRLRGAPPYDLSDVYLVPDYVSPLEEQSLARQISASQQAWVQLSGRRLQNHGGVVHSKGFLLPAPMPSWLSPLAGRVTGDVAPLGAAGGANHVLINSYRPGEGILPHSDGPLYAPVVCILSLGSPCVIRFWEKREEGGAGGLPPRASAALPPRSLLVFAGDAYEKCLHGIEEVTEERLDHSVINRRSCLVAPCLRAVDPTAAALSGSSGISGDRGSGAAALGQPAGPCGCGGGAGCSDQVRAAVAVAADAAAATPAASAEAAAPAEGLQAGATGGNWPQTSEYVLPRTGERVSLTVRRVLKVHRGLRLPGAK